MQNSFEDESAFSAITRLPITPFSAFLNDLNRPFFLNNLHPSAEIVRTGANFPESVEIPENIPSELFNCSSFNPSKIMLNVTPVKEITHDYDNFMLKVLEDCYQVRSLHAKEPQMTIPNPIISTPMKQKSSKHVTNEVVSTPTALKVKLTVVGGSSNCGALLKKLIDDESFVNPLCFDCEEDLSQIARVISAFSLSPPQSKDLEMVESINGSLSKYIEEVLEHLDQSSESIDSVKAAYSMTLIGLLNVGRLSTEELLKNYNSFDLVMRFNALCSSDSFDLILSVVIESYMALLNKFKIHDSEVSSYSSHLFELCFDATGPLSRTSAIIALSQVFSKYPEYRSYIIDQLLMKSTDAESTETQKLGITIVLTCLQALCSCEGQSNASSSVSSYLTSCLNYCWKGEGNELPKGSNVFSVLIDELQNQFSNCRWPIASVALNQCTIQMFHYLLKDESSAAQKGSLLLKLRFLDVLANISKIVSSEAEVNEKRSNWLSISQSAWFSSILSPKTAFEYLNPSMEVPNFDQEFYSNFLRSGPLSKVSERVIGLLIKLISSEVVQLRSKAIKNLFNLMNSSQLCESNYNALKASILMKAADPSISVRDASLDFISKMIFTPLPYDDGPKELIGSVISRIKDRGVSVRKRAVKVIGEILMKGIVNGTDMKLACIGNLISHIADEEDEVVVEMIFKTLKEQWIMCYIGKDFLTMLPAAQRKIMATFADEVVKVIEFLHSDIKCLQDFLGRFLVDETIKNDYSVFFSGTIEVLLENLLQTLEAYDLKNLKRSLESICLFSESNPQSLENHLGLLQSLLRSEDAEISLLSMKLISGVIPRASLTELRKLQDFEKDLLVLIYRGSEVAVKLAIGTLYHYVNSCSHQYAILTGLWQKFTEYLKARMCDEEIDPSAVPHICRAILATGVLCAQSALHREREFGLKDFHTGAQARCLLEFVAFFSRAPVTFIRSCTIQAFGSLLIACPQISISSAQLVRSFIASSLSEAEDDSCKSKCLGIFDQMIKVFNVETENASTSGNTNNNTGNNILAMEGEESYFSALIQEHLTSISNCVISGEGLEIQASALKICSSSAILGLVNPQLIIPYLAIGLNSDNDYIQSYSRSSYERLLTRFPSMISKDLLTPGKLLFRQMKKSQCVYGADKSVSKLSFYYQSLRGKTGKVGIEALNGIFGWFEEIVTSKSALDAKFEGFDPSDFINFMIEVIFTLPFSNSEEVLNCLQKIQGIFSVSTDSINSNEFLMEKFTLLKGLSYCVNFLIKSYPQVLGMSINEDEQQSMKNLQRNLTISFELPKIDEAIEVSVQQIQDFISSQPSIPVLLLQEPTRNYNTTTNKRRQSFHKPAEDEEIDDDVTGYLVDDEEISDSESDSEDDFVDIMDNSEPSKTSTTKKQQNSVNKKKISAQNKKQKKK